jgi:hypothetical protein
MNYKYSINIKKSHVVLYCNLIFTNLFLHYPVKKKNNINVLVPLIILSFILYNKFQLLSKFLKNLLYYMRREVKIENAHIIV